MTRIHVIENKISSVRRYLHILDTYKGLTVAQLAADVTLRGAVERYLYLAAQSAIDLAEAVIAYRGLRKPSTFGESFAVLLEHGMISADLADKLIRMAGFRNLLAHAYERVEYAIVCDILHHRLGDIEAFVDAIESRLP